jgi:hypothetical protein
MRRPIILMLLVGSTLAGCGRGEKPPGSDAQPAAAAAVATAKPLPASALQVRWGTLAFPRTVDADTSVPAAVSITNAGNAPWPDKVTANPQLKDGSYAVRVTHAWVPADATQDGRIGAARTDLLRPVMPGESVDVRLNIRTPVKPGEYRLIIELVQELVQWFADRGAERLTFPVHVAAAGGAR